MRKAQTTRVTSGTNGEKKHSIESHTPSSSQSIAKRAKRSSALLISLAILGVVFYLATITVYLTIKGIVSANFCQLIISSINLSLLFYFGKFITQNAHFLLFSVVCMG